MLRSGETRVWQKPSIMACPMFAHADIITCRGSAAFRSTYSACSSAPTFDLYRLATEVCCRLRRADADPPSKQPRFELGR